MGRISRDQLSFSSGEISPLLRARKDYQRFQTGLAACVGFLPLRQGGITRAPGTIFRGYTRNNAPARLIAFEFARNDAVTLELTAGVMRVWRYGSLVQNAAGTGPYELAIPYGAADLPRLQWVQSADVIYIADGARPIHKLARHALNNWTISAAAFEGGPFRVQNLNEDATIQASAPTGAITLTASADMFGADQIGSLIRLEASSYADIPLWSGNIALTNGSLMRYDGRIYRLVSGSKTGVNPPVHAEGVEMVSTDPAVQWEYVSDGIGLVRVTGVSGPRSASAQVVRRLPDAVVSAPTYRWSEGAWSPRYGYPACIEIHGQRLVAAASQSDPRTVWFSAVGAFEDFTPGTEADSAFAYAIAGVTSQNRIIWLKTGRNGLHIGALGEEYSARSDKGEEIGPTTASFGFDSSIGSKEGTRPIAPDGRPIFISKDGTRLIEIAYDLQIDGNRAIDLTLPSEHLGARGFADVVWQSTPLRLAWVRCDCGQLLALVYDPTEEVLGWARYPVAGGIVESVSVNPNAAGTVDTLTMVTRREIGGQTVRMIEEQAENWGVLAGTNPIHRAVHLFAASIFAPSAPRAGFTAPHLAGRAVHAWTDQGQFGPIAVPADGRVELPVPVGHAVIGLLDGETLAETLPIQPEAQDGSARARRKRLGPQTGVTLHNTAALRAAVVEFDTAQPEREWPAAALLPRQVGAVLTRAFSGTVRSGLVSGFAQDIAIRFRPDGGAPATLLAITPVIIEGGL